MATYECVDAWAQPDRNETPTPREDDAYPKAASKYMSGSPKRRESVVERYVRNELEATVVVRLERFAGFIERFWI